MPVHRARRKQGDDEHSLTDSIYSTIESPEAWSEVVPRVARWVGAESALLFTPMEAHLPRGFGITHNIPAEALRAYGTHYHACDVWKEAADRNGLLKAGSLFRSEQILPANAMLRSKIYADLWRPVNIAHLLCSGLTDEEHIDLGPSTLFSFFRGLRKGPFPDAELKRCKALMPHMRRAFLAARRLGVVRGLLAAYQAGLRSTGEVMLVLAPDMSVRHASSEPTEIFGSTAILQIVRGRLTANESAIRARLELAVRNAAVGQPSEPIRAQPRDSLELEITILPLDTAQLLARIRPIRRSPAEGVGRIAAGYRLTEAERRVLVLLAGGLSVADIGAELSIRIMTVRTHLANLYEKTGARSQRALVALVWQNA